MSEQQPSSAPAGEAVKSQPSSAPAPDAGHIPMTEEMDRARWTLPPPKIIGIGILVFAVIATIVLFLARAKPVAAGTIDHVVAVIMPDNHVMVGINVSFRNVLPEKPIWIRRVKAKLTRADGQEFTDTAASAVDFERYFEAFPELKQGAIAPLLPERKIVPGQGDRGMVIVAFPVDKQTFEQRKGLAVVLEPYDQLPVEIEAK